MPNNLKSIVQVASLLLGFLLVANVLFHLFIYAMDGKLLADVMWEIHAVSVIAGVTLLAIGSKVFKTASA